MILWINDGGDLALIDETVLPAEAAVGFITMDSLCSAGMVRFGRWCFGFGA